MASGHVNPRFAEMINSAAGDLDDPDFELDGGVDPWDQDFQAYDNFKNMTLDDGQVVSVNDDGFVKPDGQYTELTPTEEDDDGGYLAVNPDWLEEQWKLLSVQPWFRGDSKYRRADAVLELKDKPKGSFVVRVSFSEPGHYAISAKSRTGKVHSMLILPSWAGKDSNAPGQTQYRLGSTSKLLFNTVPKLIKYFTENYYFEGDRLRGEVKPEQQEGGYLTVTPGNPGGDDDVGYLEMGPDGQPLSKDSYMELSPTKRAGAAGGPDRGYLEFEPDGPPSEAQDRGYLSFQPAGVDPGEDE